MFDTPQLIGFHFNEEKQEIYVSYRSSSGICLTSYPPQYVPDTVWKDVYGIIDGKLTKVRSITGECIPAIPEQIVFHE